MDWNEAAEGWDDEPAVKAYASAAFERLKALAEESNQPLKGSRVLDFGCGSGLLTAGLAPLARQVVALDPAEKMLEAVRQKVAANNWLHVTVIHGALDALDAQDFDWIVCSSVLAFVPDYAATVQALANKLAPGGALAAFDWELEPKAAEPFGVARAQIRAAFERARLADIVVEKAFELSFGEKKMAPLLGAGRNRASF